MRPGGRPGKRWEMSRSSMLGRSRSPVRWLLVRGGLALLLGLAPGLAFALTIGAGGAAPFEVSPLYFQSAGAFGLASAPPHQHAATPSDFWLTAGNASFSPQLSITQSLQTPVHQHPQQPSASQNPQTVQGSATTALPYVADSIWTVRNDSGAELLALHLVFTLVDLSPDALFPNGYPDLPVAMDDGMVDVVNYVTGGTNLYFPSMSLGSLDAGESTQILVRYIVAGDLPFAGGQFQMPQFGVAGLVLAVPEPGTVLLATMGIAGLALSARVRPRHR